MRIRWRDLELPTRVQVDEESKTDSYGTFVVEPFERGFGTTVGNSLRRVLLSSLEGSAVTAVRIEGVEHQFSTMENVVEDVTDIVLNLKDLRVRLHGDGPATLRLSLTRKGAVTAADIDDNPEVEIVNPDLHICELAGQREISMELKVTRGRGYVTADDNRDEDAEIGWIFMDSKFSPVRRVRFKVEDTRVGRLTNYDRLVLDIWTDGTISPDMALVEAGKILRKHLNPFVNYFEIGKELAQERKRDEGTDALDQRRQELEEKLSTPVDDLNLSVRAANCLQMENIETLRDLVTRTEGEMLEIRNFGKTSLKEVKKKLTDMGLTFGMDLSILE